MNRKLTITEHPECLQSLQRIETELHSLAQHLGGAGARQLDRLTRIAWQVEQLRIEIESPTPYRLRIELGGRA